MEEMLHTFYWDYLIPGTWVYIPLVVCSILAAGIIVEKAFNLRPKRYLGGPSNDELRHLVASGKTESAVAVCRSNPSLFHTLILAGIEAHIANDMEPREAVTEAGQRELPAVEKHLPALGTIAGISPLIGLLGTVFGMINMFRSITESGSTDVASLSGGISLALQTTAFGLAIAIPSLAAYNYFTNRSQEILQELEKRCLAVLRELGRSETL